MLVHVYRSSYARSESTPLTIKPANPLTKISNKLTYKLDRLIHVFALRFNSTIQCACLTLARMTT